jgi:hypothetical protein
VIWLLACAQPPAAAPVVVVAVEAPAIVEDEATDVLFRVADRALRGSRFGPLATFQERLSDALVDCGLAELPIDGMFGHDTADALADLATCPGYEDLARSEPGTLDLLAWEHLAPDVAPPDALERALVLTLTFEGTDFDRAEWNLGTPGDEGSGLTWGPFGATAGWGAEVQRVLATVDGARPDLVDRAFGTEKRTLRRLLDVQGCDAAGFLRPVFDAPERRRVWKDGFARLGAERVVRDAYVEVALSDDWLGGSLARLWTLLPDPAEATEIDLAFFVDLAVHVSVTDDRLARARHASKDAGTPAERRQAIGRVFVADLGRWAEHREGRDGAYVIDGAALSSDEQAAFDRFGRVRASDVGLSDDRLSPVVF